MPVLDSGRNPNDISLANDLDRTTPLLYPANAICHDQDLAERMGVPGRTRARLEGDYSTAGAAWLSRIKERLHTNGTDKAVVGTGNELLRSSRLDRDVRGAAVTPVITAETSTSAETAIAFLMFKPFLLPTQG